MTAAEVLKRLRTFLFIIALGLFAGTIFELWLVQHYQDAVQWSAFVLGGIGFISVLIGMLRPTNAVRKIMRACMVLVIAGSLFGIYQHVSNNVSFALEIQPNLPSSELWLKGLRGANPLLAPATFAVAGLLVLAATYKRSTTYNSETTTYAESSS